ncbi:MAG TPA: C1 family peptidase [Geobacteraceae bacterium]
MTKGKTTARVLNCIPSREKEKDWTFEHAVDACLMDAALSIPSTMDLRDAWWKVGNQGETGSCVGWATADSVLRWHFVKAKRVKKTELLSVRQIWMSAKETDEYISYPTTFIEIAGTSLKSALDIARKFGVVTEKVLPFAPGKLYQGKPDTFFAMAAQLKIASYFNLGAKAADWKQWLATKGPILTRLDVDETWDNASVTNGKLAVYKPSTARGGHAVALVGYTPDSFIVRNSWGEEWGDKGFGYASLKYAQAAFTEAYGVVI